MTDPSSLPDHEDPSGEVEDTRVISPDLFGVADLATTSSKDASLDVADDGFNVSSVFLSRE